MGVPSGPGFASGTVHCGDSRWVTPGPAGIGAVCFCFCFDTGEGVDIEGWPDTSPASRAAQTTVNHIRNCIPVEATTDGDTRQSRGGGTHLELDVWHPDCWTLEVTRETGAGLIARGLYTVDGAVQARFTGYGETEAAVEALVEAARDSALTDAVRAEMDAEVEVRRIISSQGVGSTDDRGSDLSRQQSRVVEHAVERGYYEWPRQVTAADLADDLDISKSTVLEHLRKAESKVLRAAGVGGD